MSNQDFYNEDLLNQPNEAFPLKNSPNKKSSKNSATLFKIFAVLYILSAVSGVCSLFPILMSTQIYPPILVIFSVVAALMQIIINGALGFGLWTLKAWAWWLLTTINPLSVGFSFTIGFLLVRDLTKSMQAYLSSQEIAQANGFYSVGFFIGAGFSFLILALFQLLFWSKRDLFFGSKKLPMSGGEFVLMQLVVIVFSIVIAILVYLILQKSGLSIDTLIEQLDVYQTYPY
jgi:hypothetical protein